MDGNSDRIRFVLLSANRETIVKIKLWVKIHFPGLIDPIVVIEDCRDPRYLLTHPKPDLVVLEADEIHGDSLDILNLLEAMQIVHSRILAQDAIHYMCKKLEVHNLLFHPLNETFFVNVVELMLEELFAAEPERRQNYYDYALASGDAQLIQLNFLLNDKDSVKYLPISISYMKGDGHELNVFFVDKGNILHAHNSLGRQEELLDSNIWVRINRQIICNGKHIVGFIDGKTNMVKMITGEEFHVTNTYIVAFLKWWECHGNIVH